MLKDLRTPTGRYPIAVAEMDDHSLGDCHVLIGLHCKTCGEACNGLVWFAWFKVDDMPNCPRCGKPEGVEQLNLTLYAGDGPQLFQMAAMFANAASQLSLVAAEAKTRADGNGKD
jgi:NAD-dependent SIR2 family protein deacetylase